jgi:DNA polymerase-3 subunit alpha
LLSGNHHSLFGKLFKLNKLKIIEETAKELKNLFKDRFYLEIQRHNEEGEKNYENFIIKLSEIVQVPLIATQEIFYLKKEMYEAHDALVCIGQKNFVDDPNRLKFSDQHFIKKNEDTIALFQDIPEALENNYNFPYRFNFKPKKSSPVLPTIKTKENISVEDELLMQAKIGLKHRLENYIYKKDSKLNK